MSIKNQNTMAPETIADKVKIELQRGISSLTKSGHLTTEWFERDSISSPQSRLHSRILGVIARMKIEKGWVIDIERALKAAKGAKQFKPDAICWQDHNKMAFVIEFESINSSDTRIQWKDIKNYTDYVSCPSKEDNLPIIWIIITVLKNGPIKDGDWSKWDWTKGEEFHGNNIKWNLLLKSPLNFWKKHFTKNFEIAFKKAKSECPICWINIDSGRVNIELIKQR